MACCDLCSFGVADLDAFHSCATFYRIHHPEALLNEVWSLVAEWIAHHVVRGDQGSSPRCECDSATGAAAGAERFSDIEGREQARLHLQMQLIRI